RPPAGARARRGPLGAPVTGPPPIMPNLVGRNLQAAQDAVQAAGIGFYSRSHDLPGRGREQILDRNWRVCTQTPRAGQPAPRGTIPDFGVVKLTESCP